MQRKDKKDIIISDKKWLEFTLIRTNLQSAHKPQ